MPDTNEPALLDALAQRGARRNYRKGTLLIQEGDTGDTVFIVLEGRVKVFAMDANEREITYGHFGPGHYFGEMSFDGGPRSASVITTEPTVCSVVTIKSLREFLLAEPLFALDLVKTVIERARSATATARGLALSDVYGRLSHLLTSLAEKQADGSTRVTERITHQEMASRVGCSREMVSRLLKDLAEGGYLKSDGRQWVLLRALPARW